MLVFFFFFFYRLFKISDNIYQGDYPNDRHIGSVKIVQTEMNTEKSWKCRNSKQKPQYSDINMFTSSDAFSASDIREGDFKVPSFSVSSQPQEVQGNSLFFSRFYKSKN